MSVYSESMYWSELAEYYDRIRSFRDYRKEARFADVLIRKHCPGTDRVLDMCCGTGSHALQMADLGYRVTGVDMSGDMLAIARSKAENRGNRIEFRQGDVFNMEFEERFDAAYCLGYTFLYMTTHEKARAFLQSVFSVLSEGALFILDFLNGWSLIDDHSRDKVTYRFDDATIYASEKTDLDRKNRVRHIEFEYRIEDLQGRVKTVAADEQLRIFFEDEVKLLLESCGFNGVKAYGDYSFEPHSEIPGIVLISGIKAG